MANRHVISRSEIASGLEAYKGVPDATLKSACARYLASLNTEAQRRETSLRMPAEERQANARAAIAARWSKRPAGELTADQAAVITRMSGSETVTIKATAPRRRAAIAALAAAEKLWVVSQTATQATLSSVTPKSAK
jgi:hypothetical protein